MTGKRSRRVAAAVGAITTIVLSALTVLAWSGDPVSTRRTTQVPPSVQAKVHNCEIHRVDIERLHWPCDAEVEAGCDRDIPIAYRREDVTSYPYCLRKSGMLRGQIPKDEVFVHCRRDGSIDVDAQVVAARPEGVRVNLKLDAYRRTWIRGLRIEGKDRQTRSLSAAAPGFHLVSCSHFRQRPEQVSATLLMLVVDPADYWIPPPLLDCSGGRGGGASFGSVPLDAGDPAAVVRDHYKGFIRASDEVVISGYKFGSARQFHALRQGRAFYAVGLSRSADVWHIANSESCMGT